MPILAKTIAEAQSGRWLHHDIIVPTAPEGNGDTPKEGRHHIEVESGRKSARPQLLAAIAQAQREDALLLVAKLNWLARSVAFLATLMESRVRFQAVEFTLHILAAVAQKEASVISSRTRAALAAKKARGFQLGTPANLTDEAKLKGLTARQTNVNISAGRVARDAAVGYGREFASYCGATQSVGLHYEAREGLSPHGHPAPIGRVTRR